MTRDERANVINGLVRFHDRWIPIDEKVRILNEFRERAEAGYIRYQGEWITLDEKVNRVTRNRSDVQSPDTPPQVIYNTTINRQVYSTNNATDNRTFHNTQVSHEHRHVHVDSESFVRSFQPGERSREQSLPRGKADRIIQLPSTDDPSRPHLSHSSPPRIDDQRKK